MQAQKWSGIFRAVIVAILSAIAALVLPHYMSGLPEIAWRGLLFVLVLGLLFVVYDFPAIKRIFRGYQIVAIGLMVSASAVVVYLVPSPRSDAGHPWVNATVAGENRGSNGDVITSFAIAFSYVNRGTQEAVDLIGTVRIAGRIQKCDWPTTLAVGEEGGTPFIEFRDEKAAEIDGLINNGGKIKCDLRYKGLGGDHVFGITRRWIRDGPGKPLRELRPRLRGYGKTVMPTTTKQSSLPSSKHDH